MYRLLYKIFKTGVVAVPVSALDKVGFQEIEVIGKELKMVVNKYFKGSLAIREVDAGSTNACEQELVALSNPYYDVERFGIHFVASPRHADMLIVTGPVSRNMVQGLRRTYEATPDPKIVVALGDDAISGGIFRGSYAVMDGVHNIVLVDFHIPGDPPTPKEILAGLLYILETVGSKRIDNSL